MDSILKEKLLNQAEDLSRVSNIYRTESARFVDVYFNWLESAEKELSGLRSPFSVLLQSEKTKVTSVLDGYLPDNVHGGRSMRRNQRAVAAQSLTHISQAIYTKIEHIENEFNHLNEKICHALAILAGKDRHLFDIASPTESEIEKIWQQLMKHPETLPMHNYLSAKLSAVDRKYLLINAVQHILDNKPAEETSKNNTLSTKNNVTEEKTGPLEVILHSLLHTFSKLDLKKNSFSELLDKAASATDRKKLSQITTVDEDDILLLAKCADMQRITGITFPLAFILLSAGIDSVVELGRRNANNLNCKIISLIDESQYEIQAPETDILQTWIDEARKLPRRLSF